jgi:hypothetical protein
MVFFLVQSSHFFMTFMSFMIFMSKALIPNQ